MTFQLNKNFPKGKFILLTVCTMLFAITAFAQPQNAGRPAGSGAGQPGRPPAKGRVYGKIFDARTNKPLEFVVLKTYL
jgi:hypothetical protein